MITQTDRLTKLVEWHKHIFDCDEFKRLSYEVLGSFSIALKEAGCTDPEQMAQNVHGVAILGYMLGYEQRGKQGKKK